LKLNGKLQVLVYADDISYVSGKLNTVKESTEAVLVASREICLDADTEKTEYMFKSHEHNGGYNQYLKMADI
jgi:hypothetical protein